jgi:hypothetical protein
MKAENQLPEDLEWSSPGETKAEELEQEVEQDDEDSTEETDSEEDYGTEEETSKESDNESDEEETEEEETVFTIDGVELSSPDKEEDNSVIRSMRSELKAAKQALKERESELETFRSAPVVVEELPPVPNQYDFDTDEDFNKALTGWIEKRDQIQTNKLKAEGQSKAFETAFKQKSETYMTRFNEIAKVYPRIKEAQESVKGSLDVSLQNEILFESEKPAEVVLALGSNTELLEEYKAIKSPVARGRFLAKIEKGANLESRKKKVNTTPKKPNNTAGKPKKEVFKSKMFPDAVFK